MKIVFIVNNKNNRLSKALPIIEQYCRNKNIGETHFLFTKNKKHAIQLAQEACENNCSYLIAVGGDGTLSEVINGVLKSNINKDQYPALGLLPYGSANDFSRSAKISNSIEELIDMIEENCTKRIDIGRILLNNNQTRYFINIAGLGLGAEIVQKIERSSNLLGSKINYFKFIIKGFLSYRKKEVICKSSKWKWKGKLLQMAVANGRFFGNAICIAPDANLNNGLFQVVIFGDLSIWDYLKNLANLKKGKKINLSEAKYLSTDEIIIESNYSLGIEADGEYVGLAPAQINIIPKAIEFLMPSN